MTRRDITLVGGFEPLWPTGAALIPCPPVPAAAELGGFRIHPLTAEAVIAQIAHAVADRRRLIMANINFHGMAVAYHNAPMRRLLAAPETLVMIDSMPLIFIARWFGHRLHRHHRTTSLDFYDDMFALGIKRSWRFGFVGGTQAVVDAGVAVLTARHPGLQLQGQHGFFALDDRTPGSHQAAILDWLGTWAPDVLIVGMGMPRQEEWIERVCGDVAVPVFLPAGGYLDYQTGAQRMAPRWMGQLGIEWAFRLVTSPRRLAFRYLVEPLGVLKRLLFGPPLPSP